MVLAEHEITEAIQKYLGPAITPVNLKEHYSFVYEKEIEDSPDEERRSMVDRMHTLMHTMQPEDILLDLGAGIQIVQSNYIETYGSPSRRIITVDQADVIEKETGKSRLLVNHPMVRHLQASVWDEERGLGLPLVDNTVGGGMSNLALDLMPENARKELYRVLKPGAKAILSLHHPTVIPIGHLVSLREKKEAVQRKIERGDPLDIHKDLVQLQVWHHKTHLFDDELLFKSEEEIANTFSAEGFMVHDVRRAETKKDWAKEYWWEVDLQKPEK